MKEKQKMEITDHGSASKIDQEIHKKALAALAHYYAYGDSTLLTKVVRGFPNSNRRVAMLEWLQKFSVLHWDRTREVLVRKKVPEHKDLDGASSIPFWTLKVKQEQRRHVSGNTFEPDHFFDRVFADIQANIHLLSTANLEIAVVELQKLLEIRRKRDARNKSEQS